MSVTKGRKRSVAIRLDLDARIRDFVEACGRSDIDMDYSSAFNLIADLGQKWVEGSTVPEREKHRGIWESYLDYDRLEKEGVIGDWREYEEFRRWKLAKAKADKGPE